MQSMMIFANVTLWYSIKTNVHSVKLFPPSGRGMILVFEHYHCYKIPGELAQQGVKYTGVGKICDFLQKSSFISETV